MLHCNMKLLWQSSYAFLDAEGFSIPGVSHNSHYDHRFASPFFDCCHRHGIESRALVKSIGCCGQRFSAACPVSVST